MLSVQTNLGANTALKNINQNSVNMNKSLERLSSGFRINNAADDAAGFAVSSKLDAQSSRLKAASLNASQAQAMVKMADAGVNEIQNMVSRVQTLAIQASSANNAGELGKLDAERVKLEGAINKIANSTNFNGTNLLNGIDANSGAVAAVTAVTAVTGTSATAGTITPATAATITATGTALFSNAATFSLTTDATGKITSITSSVALTSKADSAVTLAAAGTNLLNAADVTTPTKTPGAIAALGLTFANTNVATTGVGPTSTVAYTAGTAQVTGVTGVAASAAGTGAYAAALSFQVGADNNAQNQVGVDLTKSYTTTGLNLGSGTGTAAGGNLLTQAAAQTYITTAKNALDTLITNRADLGATQNQVAFVQANLATSIEQTTASVSSIRDADMASEMADFTKNKILTQASTSMLAQANQAAQNVLSLFR